MVCTTLSSRQWLPPAQRAEAERVNSPTVLQAYLALYGNFQLAAHTEEVRDFDDDWKGVFSRRLGGEGVDQFHGLHHLE